MKTITVELGATYETRGTLSAATKRVVIALHGYGQLAKHFIRRFDGFDAATYVVAPQGLSKFYLKDYAHVGASWMTKDERALDILNQERYLNAVFAAEFAEVDWSQVELVLFGFSQGVSAASRWLAKARLPIAGFVAYSGSLGNELTAADFEFLPPNARVIGLLGERDEFYNGAAAEQFRADFLTVFPTAAFRFFDGGHRVERAVLDATFADLFVAEGFDRV